MQQKTIEGTWEEVTRRSQELAGHRVRVTVLDDVTLPKATNGTHPDQEVAPTVKDPILGMFSDAPELLDEVVEQAMKDREAAFKRHLLETGLVSQLPTAHDDSAKDEDDAPIVVSGEPLSETILRERR